MDRLSLAARDLIEVLEVGSAESPRSRKTHGLIGEDLGQGRKEVARDLDRTIQHEDHPATRDANERIASGTLAEIAIGEVGLDATIMRGDVGDPVLRLISRT